MAFYLLLCAADCLLTALRHCDLSSQYGDPRRRFRGSGVGNRPWFKNGHSGPKRLSSGLDLSVWAGPCLSRSSLIGANIAVKLPADSMETFSATT